jgi:hypothetical protein
MDETTTTSHAGRRLAVSTVVPVEIVSAVCIELQFRQNEDAVQYRAVGVGDAKVVTIEQNMMMVKKMACFMEFFLDSANRWLISERRNPDN